MRSREDALHLKWHSLFFWRITPSSAPAFNHAGEFDTFPNFITVSESKYNHRKSFRSSWRRVYKQLPCAPGEVVNLSSNFTATSEVNRGSNPRHPGAAQSCSSLYRVHHSPLQCSQLLLHQRDGPGLVSSDSWSVIAAVISPKLLYFPGSVAFASVGSMFRRITDPIQLLI